MSLNLRRPLSSADALAMLREGNDRFVRGERGGVGTQARRRALAGGQSPSAIVLSCADSRVPAELVFGCDLGDLFVVRVAGNVCAPSLVGSVEYAAETFGTQLVVVLGHTRCGAVTATIDALTTGERPGSPNIDDIVERIAPAVSGLVGRGLGRDALVAAAVRANVRHASDHLRHGSHLLAGRVGAGKLVVVGAEYSLETGVVSFLELPAALAAAA